MYGNHRMFLQSEAINSSPGLPAPSHSLTLLQMPASVQMWTFTVFKAVEFFSLWLWKNKDLTNSMFS
jgi:hypothetical protein